MPLQNNIYVLVPDAVQDFPIWKYSDINVWYNNLMFTSFLLIAEKCIGHPHLGRIS